MIEQLTETNLNLESKIEELEAQVADLVSVSFLNFQQLFSKTDF
jgi:cell division septum initiation protein DivIVA